MESLRRHKLGMGCGGVKPEDGLRGMWDALGIFIVCAVIIYNIFLYIDLLRACFSYFPTCGHILDDYIV